MEDRKKVNAVSLPAMLDAYARGDDARFHMPGHKGRGLSGLRLTDMGRWDITELSFSDNLQNPTGVLRRAEAALADAYGAKASFFVVNGGTAAVLAMLLSLNQNDRLLLARDCHKSAIAGVALSGLETDTILPERDKETGAYGMVTAEALGEALDKTHATAVLITSPNAYGLTTDTAALSRVAHAHGALLLVDAAHGAHYPFSPALPDGLAGRADLFSHSQHKTMNALTQAASLHLGDCRVSEDAVRRALSLVQTTSPSYLLMASVDWAVFTARRQDWTGLVARAERLRAAIRRIPGLAAPSEPLGAGACQRDLTRLVIDVTGRGLSGYEAQAELERRGIYLEMADMRQLVLILSPEDEPAWYDRLLEALMALPTSDRTPAPPIPPIGTREKRMTVREATLSRQSRVALSEAAGRVAGAAVGVYPPGVASCMPGELFDREAILALLEAERGGASLFGVENGCVSVVEDLCSGND